MLADYGVWTIICKVVVVSVEEDPQHMETCKDLGGREIITTQTHNNTTNKGNTPNNIHLEQTLHKLWDTLTQDLGLDVGMINVTEVAFQDLNER